MRPGYQPAPKVGTQLGGSRANCVWTRRGGGGFDLVERAGALILVNDSHRDEVALLSGLAAAVDKYEDAPHDGTTLGRPAAARHGIHRSGQMMRRTPAN